MKDTYRPNDNNESVEAINWIALSLYLIGIGIMIWGFLISMNEIVTDIENNGLNYLSLIPAMIPYIIYGMIFVGFGKIISVLEKIYRKS